MPLLTLNSLLPSQSLFNEIQSIHETGFFHELDSFFCCKDGVPATPSSTQVNSSARRMHEKRYITVEKGGVYLHSTLEHKFCYVVPIGR